MPTQAKVESVGELKLRLSGVRSAVLADYRGLTVQQMGALRRQLKSVSADVKVVKNRLARIALRDSELAILSPHLTGPTALAYSAKDPVALAKALQAFQKTTPAFQIKAGVVEGQAVPPEGVKALADLPSREVILAQVVGAFQAPIAKFVMTLNQVLVNLVLVLKAASERKDA